MSSPQVSKQAYDRRENILRVWHPTPVALDDEQLIRAYFDDIYRFWKQSCAGQRAYYLVNWDGFDVNPHETESYASNVLTLNPGDIVSMGTPSGTNIDVQTAARWMKAGDVGVCVVDGVGEQRHNIVAQK